MNKIKLEPCPFCGGKASVCLSAGAFIYVRCTECNVQMEGHYAKTKEENEALENINKCATRAAEEWNTRKPMERIMKQAEEIKTYSVSPQFNKGVDAAIEIIRKGGAE